LDPSALLREAVRRYEELRPLYGAFCVHVRQLVSAEIARRSIKIHSIEARTKSVESFERKIKRLLGLHRASHQAPDPLRMVTDMAGVRVITFFPKTVLDIDAVIRERFPVIERDDKTEFREAPSSFGYRSIHYLVEMAPGQLESPDLRWYQGLVAEIQVRTILQHAWAEIEHDIQYKSVRATPPAIRRRLAAVAGLLEIADREFQAIRDESDRSRKLPPAGKTGRDPSRGSRVGCAARTNDTRKEVKP
jgi:ppGpp synthetase/RelA/SpoT-type nucleotidyltranferase